MAGRALVLRRRNTKIDTIEVDACLDETHTLTNTVTDHPVEQGFNVTDHSRPDPDRVTLRCFVSNTPLSQEQVSRAIRSGAIDFTTSAARSVELPVFEVTGRGGDAYTKLKKLRDEGALVEVVTTLKTYVKSDTEGMMIESITIPRTRQNYDGLEFTVVLKQVRIVKNKQATIVKQREKNTRKKKKEGQKTTEEGNEKEKSLAAKMADTDVGQKVGKTIGGLLGF